MTPFQCAEFFFDEDIQIESLFWLPSVMANMPDSLADILSDDFFEEAEKAFGFSLESFGTGDQEEWLSRAAREKKYGFIVIAATPVPEYLHGTTYQAGWGHYRRGFFYTDSLDEAFIERLKKWRKTIHDAAKKKLAKTRKSKKGAQA